MNHATFRVWTAITWVVTLGIAYIVGWYKGIASVAHVAMRTGHAGIDIVLIALVVVAIASAAAALRATSHGRVA